MRRQRGFSLIEALIALLVLSLGLVGVAAMQLKALQSATAGYQRSVVTLAAVDAQERLWAALARLDSSENCTDIDLDTAVTIQGDEDNPGWEGYWFGDDSTTPIRNFTGVVEEGSEDCEFEITINLEQSLIDTENQEFTYTLRLPDL